MNFSCITQLPLEPSEDDLTEKNPWNEFAIYYKEAESKGVKDPAIASLATATCCGAPSCRIVRLSMFDNNGLVIYTSTLSRKSREIKLNPQAALCFYWPEAGRQIRLEGHVSEVSNDEAEEYFESMPAKFKIGAAASRQSEPMKEKSDLIKRIAGSTAKLAVGQLKKPEHWTGFRIVPDYFEFWSDNSGTIHERKVFYQRDGRWYIAELQP